LMNAIYAKSFDDVNIIPSFVITPLIYLGWVFYSVQMLPPLFEAISKFNPILYMINGLRYAFIGVSDVNIYISLAMLIIFSVLLYWGVYYLLKNGKNIRG
jgi:ABC-2 type transport system permease protein